MMNPWLGMMKHLNIRVTGRVQGVFFRASARETARMLGLAGFVCNEPDGSVYIEAEGEEENLVHFVDWCKRGPQHAVVSNIQVKEDQMQNLVSFRIKQ
jgi:acylphosphatase